MVWTVAILSDLLWFGIMWCIIDIIRIAIDISFL